MSGSISAPPCRKLNREPRRTKLASESGFRIPATHCIAFTDVPVHRELFDPLPLSRPKSSEVEAEGAVKRRMFEPSTSLNRKRNCRRYLQSSTSSGYHDLIVS